MGVKQRPCYFDPEPPDVTEMLNVNRSSQLYGPNIGIAYGLEIALVPGARAGIEMGVSNARKIACSSSSIAGVSPYPDRP
jgi:hypothetical protein